MATLAGYLLDDKLHDGIRHVVWRAHSEAGLPVVMKASRSSPPDSRATAVLEKELRLVRRLCDAGVQGIPRGLEMARDDRVVAIIYEDVQATALASVIRRSRPGVLDAMRWGARLAQVLAGVHRAGVVHKDVNPSNVVVRDEGLWLIDYDAASPLSREPGRRLSLNNLEGTLPYLAPEQTGRMNRPIDDRADLYGLGATLYELLAGRPPFVARDPLEMVHRHLATVPEPPSSLAPGLPAVIDEIVLRLLAKDPDDRYGSAQDVAADLEQVTQRLQAGLPLDGLTSGRSTRHARFRLPTRLYGREAEVTTLHEAWARARGGGNELALVTGWSGIGKSSVVEELHVPVARSGGHYVAGKGDPLRRGVPWAPVTQLLTDLTHQVISEGGPGIAMLDALNQLSAAESGALVDVVPALRPLLPHAVVPPPLDGDPARARIQEALVLLVRALARTNSPICLFFDDVQWADEATLALLQRLTTDPAAAHLLVVLAWRHHEVDAAHPWTLRLAAIEAERRPPHPLDAPLRLHLQGLKQADVARLVGATLQVPPESVSALADSLSTRTDGNPFFLRQILEDLYARGLIHEAPGGGWEVDLVGVAAMEASEDLGQFVASRLDTQPTPTTDALAMAATIGLHFHLRLLAAVGGREPLAVARTLWPALEEGLIVPLDAGYDLLEGSEIPGDVDPAFRFAHDRVRQAAADRLDADQAVAAHVRIARTLLAADHEPDDDRLVAIGVHLAKGLPALRAAPDRLTLAALFLRAGTAAVEASSFDTALTQFVAGLTLLGSDGESDLRWHLEFRRAGCTWQVGDADAAQRQFEALVQSASDPLRKATVANALTELYTGRGRYHEAVDAGVRGLGWLGIRFPARPNMAHMIHELLRLRWQLRGRTIADIEALPDVEDPSVQLAMEILNNLAAPGRYVDQVRLSSTLICRMCRLSLRHGHAPATAFAWGQYGFLSGPVLGDIPSAGPWSELAGRLADRFDDLRIRPLVLFLRAGLIDPWRQPASACIPMLIDAMHASVSAGNTPFYVNSVAILVSLRLASGEPLAAMEADCDAGLQFARRHGVDVVDQSLVTYRQMVRCLRGQTVSPDSFDDADFDEAGWLARWADTPYQIGISAHHLLRLLVAVALERWADAERHAVDADHHLPAGHGVSYTQLHPYLRLLHTAATARPGDRAALRRCQRWLHTMEGWARANPLGLGHRLEVMHAEIARLQGRVDEAMTGYERALLRARNGRYTWDVALIAAAAARLHTQSGRRTLAAPYVHICREAWQDVGATLIVRQIDLAWPTLLPGTVSGNATTSIAAPTLDLTTALRASVAIGEELVIERVLSRMLDLASENVGARRAVFIMPRDGQPVVVAERTPDGEDGSTSRLRPVSERVDLATSVIRLVWHTHEPVRIADTRTLNRFQGDPWVATGTARTILCVPFLHRGELAGALYLEHDLLADAFPAERQELLALLGGQIGNALANATLYREKEELLASFSRFVPQEFLQQLGREHIHEIRLGDAVQRHMAVLFADIRNFTAMSEAMPPDLLFQHLNAWLGHVAPAIRADGGFVDKYIGDAILALFPRNTDDAVRAAIALQRATTAFNETTSGTGRPPIRIGVGVHCGPTILGTVGEHRRMDTTVISDAVNVASRLEGLTKEYKAPIIASDAVCGTVSDASAFHLRWLGTGEVRGRMGQVSLHEVYDHLPEADRWIRDETRLDFERGVQHLHTRDKEQARSCFDKVLAVDPSDQTAAVLRERCA